MIPAATSDLVVTQRADRVLLSWSYPALTTAGKNLTEVRRISIYRYEETLPVAPGGRDPKTLMPGDVDPTQAQSVVQFSRIPTVPQAQFEAQYAHRQHRKGQPGERDRRRASAVHRHAAVPFRGRPPRAAHVRGDHRRRGSAQPAFEPSS
jgi:hypothetical protein